MHTASNFPSTSDALVFARLFVGPAERRHGVGEQLVRAAMAYVKEQTRPLVLDVMDKDHAAIRLYERLGWQHIGTATHRFGERQSITALCYVAPS
ncbi:GNAT family N-acetyltransferase [Nocardia farcinica]|nr:GNAT family N-acetyltransferase [Nocardia farcinica]MBF6294978.1 GNAT family N-acetyltransferase [Nocardia farcinica]MBF6381464.1 GNAT family N-acetyltransferase [Nocardia farcinica]MBF6576914.1 GNAT family N-acetyltransferase [Nocardia farcinica]